MNNPLICPKCLGQMQPTSVAELFECEECKWKVSAVEEVNYSK